MVTPRRQPPPLSPFTSSSRPPIGPVPMGDDQRVAFTAVFGHRANLKGEFPFRQLLTREHACAGTARHGRRAIEVWREDASFKHDFPVGDHRHAVVVRPPRRGRREADDQSPAPRCRLDPSRRIRGELRRGERNLKRPTRRIAFWSFHGTERQRRAPWLAHLGD